MKPKTETAATQLQRELDNLKVGPHQENASTWIKPVNLMATGLTEPDTIRDYILEELQENDVYNGHVFIGYRQAMDYLTEHDGEKYQLQNALYYAAELGYTLDQIERHGPELLANIAANEQAIKEDRKTIEKSVEKIALILQASMRVREEEPTE